MNEIIFDMSGQTPNNSDFSHTSGRHPNRRVSWKTLGGQYINIDQPRNVSAIRVGSGALSVLCLFSGSYIYTRSLITSLGIAGPVVAMMFGVMTIARLKDRGSFERYYWLFRASEVLNERNLEAVSRQKILQGTRYSRLAEGRLEFALSFLDEGAARAGSENTARYLCRTIGRVRALEVLKGDIAGSALAQRFWTCRSLILAYLHLLQVLNDNAL